MSSDRLTDEEIERLISEAEARSVHHEGLSFHKDAATALRQLLEENRKLRERLEPCRHEEVEAAGAEWWRCHHCKNYIHRDDYKGAE